MKKLVMISVVFVLMLNCPMALGALAQLILDDPILLGPGIPWPWDLYPYRLVNYGSDPIYCVKVAPVLDLWGLADFHCPVGWTSSHDEWGGWGTLVWKTDNAPCTAGQTLSGFSMKGPCVAIQADYDLYTYAYGNLVSSGHVNVPAPEPATICLLGLGALGLLRKHKK